MHIELPYEPRKAFMPFHNRTKRWACIVAHRRAGKTVAAVNDIIRYQGALHLGTISEIGRAHV